jgi:hypothetical protein
LHDTYKICGNPGHTENTHVVESNGAWWDPIIPSELTPTTAVFYLRDKPNSLLMEHGIFSPLRNSQNVKTLLREGRARTGERVDQISDFCTLHVLAYSSHGTKTASAQHCTDRDKFDVTPSIVESPTHGKVERDVVDANQDVVISHGVLQFLGGTF